MSVPFLGFGAAIPFRLLYLLLGLLYGGLLGCTLVENDNTTPVLKNFSSVCLFQIASLRGHWKAEVSEIHCIRQYKLTDPGASG